MGAAFFFYPARDYVLVGLMLFLPLLDQSWQPPKLLTHRRYAHILAGILLAAAGLLIWQPTFLSYAVSTLLLAAIPEEWFFRGYLMTRLGGDTRANLISSVFFSLVHGLTRGWSAAVLVFVPSLFYGWLYRRTRDLPLLVLAHALSNLVYALFLADFVATRVPDLR
jgi:membrane protease YdiL (CAAX protease family)